MSALNIGAHAQSGATAPVLGTGLIGTFSQAHSGFQEVHVLLTALKALTRGFNI